MEWIFKEWLGIFESQIILLKKISIWIRNLYLDYIPENLSDISLKITSTIYKYIKCIDVIMTHVQLYRKSFQILNYLWLHFLLSCDRMQMLSIFMYWEKYSSMTYIGHGSSLSKDFDNNKRNDNSNCSKFPFPLRVFSSLLF